MCNTTKGDGQGSESLTLENIRHNVIGLDVQVPLLNGSMRTYVNFDNAASTPPLRPVFDIVNDFAHWYSSVHRGTGLKSQVSTSLYEQAHQIVCDFVGADPQADTVIFVKNSTEALNKLARRISFSPGDVVLTTTMEHHSNDLPWRSVAHVEHVRVDKRGALDIAHLDALLDQHADTVRLVAVTGASNVTGFVNPIHQIAEKAHAVGAEIVVDAAQLAPHRPIQMHVGDEAQRIDYLVLSAHKMYAPYGSGALVGRRSTFADGQPDQVGGGTVDIVTRDHVEWASLPEREEAGSPNVIGAVAMAQSMLCLQQLGMDRLAEHETGLTAYMLEKLTSLEGVHVYGITDPERAGEKVGVVSFSVGDMSHYLVAAILSCEGGIGVRNGCFCAHPYLLELIDVAPEEARAYQKDIRRGIKARTPGLVRASFGCYNDESEVDWFIEILQQVVRGEYDGEYVQDPATGEFWPSSYQVDPETYFGFQHTS
jgi:selenocysteine lyase/cysteine desulfurase